MQRVTVEFQPRQQHGTQHAQRREHANHRQARAQQHRLRPPGPGKADLGRLAARLQQREASRQEGQGADQRHQHPGAGDQPKLGHTAKAGRHKGQEPGRNGHGGQHDLRPDRQHGLVQRQGGIPGVQPLLAVAYAELDGEIDGDADEQHRKRDRDQVQRPYRQRREPSGEQQAEHQRGGNGHDQPPGAHRQHQPQQHQRRADHHPGHRPIGHGRELLVGECHRAGHPNRRPPRLHRRQSRRRLPQHGRRRPPGLQRPEVKPRLRQHKPARSRQLNQLAAQQALPRQRRRPPGGGIGQRTLEPLHRRGKAVERGLAAIHSHCHQRQGGEQPARARVGRQLPQERLRVDRPVQQLGKIRLVQEQQGVARKPWIGIRPPGKPEMRGVGRQRGSQAGRRLLGLLRRRPLDHGNQQVAELWKRRGQCNFALAPWQPGIEQRIRVSGDPKAPPGQRRTQHAQHQTSQHHPPRPQTAEFGSGGKQRRQSHQQHPQSGGPDSGFIAPGPGGPSGP